MNKTKRKNLKSELKKTIKSKEIYQKYKSVIKLQSEGYSRKQACMIVGIPRSKFYYWHRKVIRILKLKRAGSKISPKHFRAISTIPKLSPRKTSSKKRRPPIEYANMHFGLNITSLPQPVQDVWKYYNL